MRRDSERMRGADAAGRDATRRRGRRRAESRDAHRGDRRTRACARDVGRCGREASVGVSLFVFVSTSTSSGFVRSDEFSACTSHRRRHCFGRPAGVRACRDGERGRVGGYQRRRRRRLGDGQARRASVGERLGVVRFGIERQRRHGPDIASPAAELVGRGRRRLGRRRGGLASRPRASLAVERARRSREEPSSKSRAHQGRVPRASGEGSAEVDAVARGVQAPRGARVPGRGGGDAELVRHLQGGRFRSRGRAVGDAFGSLSFVGRARAVRAIVRGPPDDGFRRRGSIRDRRVGRRNGRRRFHLDRRAPRSSRDAHKRPRHNERGR